jgi:hypothetical protein
MREKRPKHSNCQKSEQVAEAYYITDTSLSKLLAHKWSTVYYMVETGQTVDFTSLFLWVTRE